MRVRFPPRSTSANTPMPKGNAFHSRPNPRQRCLHDGIDVRGYIHWSLLDDFEWIFGYGPKSGLVAVDRETHKRMVKPSATLLGTIAKSNSL